MEGYHKSIEENCNKMNLHKDIEQAIRQHEEILYVDDGVREDDIRYAIRWVMRENPDIFWFVHQYHFDKDKGVVSFRYRCSPERCAVIQKSIDDVVEKDFQINYVRTLTQLEQAAYVYKWMLTYCNYNTNSAYNQNIDSVFVRRNSVCTGYAKAAQYLFKLLGIESRLVFGRLNNDKDEERHCWNVVCVKGTWYHFDVCMGDLALEDVLKRAGTANVRQYGDFVYNCFCVSTESILETRSIENIESLPSCNSSLPLAEVERLSRMVIKVRDGITGCLLTHIGSSADIFLCTKNKNVVLKKFRGIDTKKCEEEYGYMDSLKGCKHLLQLNSTYSDVWNNILAIEQSTPIVDLFCSHYYHPSLNGVLKMLKDITLGWLECQQQGIMYRDIHVCNIYKANDGNYKLGDFGSCTYELRGLRERVGNPWFMSPETYISGQFDECSAVYSITTVLYFVLNGLRPPFMDGNNEEEALWRKMNGEALPEPALLQSFPKELAEVFMVEIFARGCAYYPSKRIQTCRQLLYTIDVLCSNLKNQSVELRFVQQDTETIFDNKTIPNVCIPQDIHHRFVYGEEVERTARSMTCSSPQEDVEAMATTDLPYFFDLDNDGNSDEEVCYDVLSDYMGEALTDDDIDAYLIPMHNETESYCGSMEDEMSWESSSFNVEFNNTFEPAPIEMSDNLPPLMVGSGSAIGEALPHIGTIFGGLIGAAGGLFVGKTKSKKDSNDSSFLDDVYSSIFAPSEIKLKSRMIVQVYLHLYEETEKVKALAQESVKDAVRRDYIPLQCKLKKGDKVDVLLNIYGETLLMSDKKSVIWQGSFTKCSFDYFVPKDIDVEELSCVALLSVNGVPVGEMRFITKIVEHPRQLNPEIIAHKFNKVFISYSHQDESKVKFLHEGLELGSVPHFFDRKYLKTGDVFPQVIQDYINSADLFILCWSENASKSEYVQKERLQALERAFPQVKPEQEAKLRIYPMSIEPRAELPLDMKENYHFGEI